MAGDVLRAKLQRPGGTSSDAALAVGGLDGSLPQFFSVLSKNWVFRLRPLTAHLPYPPMWPLSHLHKNGSPDR